jgi:hypothetical protein
MYSVSLFEIITMNPPVQRIYPNENEIKITKRFCLLGGELREGGKVS